jgi:DNA-binding transcriptional ArsR family regulator
VAIRFRIEDRGGAAGFALSPVSEALVSLHVLLFPKHHSAQHPWIRAMHRVSPPLKREIQAFVFAFQNALPDCMLPAGIGDRPAFAEQLARIREVPLELFAYDLARPLFYWNEPDGGGPERLADTELRDVVLERARSASPETLAAAELIYADPDALRERFLGLLERYWDEAFGPEWGRLEPRLAAEIDESGPLLEEDGLYALLERQPELRVDRREGALVRRSIHEHDVEVTPERPLVLMPSAYVWPHVRANCDAPWPLTLVYAARFARTELDRAPEGLVAVLRALADETRLRALRLIAEQPRSTEELAPLVGLSESGLSKHLRLLAEVGLVTTRREGYYVLYAFDRSALDRWPGELAGFVDPGEG